MPRYLSISLWSCYSLKDPNRYLLFQDEDELLLVLEDVFEVDDLVGPGTHGQESDLVENLGGAVNFITQSKTLSSQSGIC